jgi:hypothetical protein
LLFKGKNKNDQKENKKQSREASDDGSENINGKSDKS